MVNSKIIEEIFRESIDKHNDFLDYVNTLPISVQIVPLALGYHIYRARHTPENNTLDKFDEFKHPPVSNGYSRVGTPGDIWFYSSETKETCLVEMIRELKEKYSLGSKIRITFGSWQVRQKVNVFVIPDFNMRTDLSHHLKLDEYYSKEERKIWEFLTQYFYLSTSVNSEIHQLTSAIVSSMMLRAERDDTQIDGLIFPSIEHQKKVNLAIKPNLIDTNKVILHEVSDMILKKNETLNPESGLPSYFGPLGERTGTYNHQTEKINWWN